MDSGELIFFRFKMLSPYLDEHLLRLWGAAEASCLGYGGVSLVCRITGISRSTIKRGQEELAFPLGWMPPKSKRIRRPGGGRKPKPKNLTDREPRQKGGKTEPRPEKNLG
jgi:hypothetical protein